MNIMKKVIYLFIAKIFGMKIKVKIFVAIFVLMINVIILKKLNNV